MSDLRYSPKTRFQWLSFVMTTIALLLALITGVWGMFRDLGHVTESVTRAEVAKFQSHADRTVSRIESEIRDTKDLKGFVKNNPRWFEALWISTVRRMPEVLYGAILDVDNRSIEDSNRLIVTDRFNAQSPDLILLPTKIVGVPRLDILPEATLLPPSKATHNNQVLDVTYAIRSGNETLGFYRVGMNFSLLESKLGKARARVLGGWTVVLVIIAVIVIGACISLYRLGLHTVRLEHQLGTAELRRVDELHRLIVGLAHEVRNPLNAIRLNLFASKKILRVERDAEIEDVAGMLDESVEEIERMDGLIGQLLGYARVAGKPASVVDAGEQVQSVLRFFKQAFDQSHIRTAFVTQGSEYKISLDPQSLRQVMINLFQNACQAMPKGGELIVEIGLAESQVVIDVHDSGPGLDPTLLGRIFEPFFTTREDGVGMGLAVVKGLVESSKGSISCERSNTLGGMKFRLSFPCVNVEVVS